MITFVNLCSYRLVFSKNLIKIGGLRVPLFLCVCPKGRGSTQKMSGAKAHFYGGRQPGFFLFSRTGMDALGRKNAGQKKARTSRASGSFLVPKITTNSSNSNITIGFLSACQHLIAFVFQEPDYQDSCNFDYFILGRIIGRNVQDRPRTYTLNILPSCLNSSSLSPASSWRISISSSMELLSAHSLSISNSRRLICSLPFHLLP